MHRCLISKPKVVILLVLMVSWMEDPAEFKDEIEFIEFFSGVGRVATLAHRAGYQSVGYDLEYGKARAVASGRRNPLDINSSAGLVLAIKLVLRSKFDACVATFACCCSSFVPVNRGTGGRDLLVPEGNEQVPSVRKANKMLSRIHGYRKTI